MRGEDRHPGGRRGAGLVMGIGWLLAGSLALAGPAAADDGSLLVDLPGDDVGFTHDPGAPLVDLPRLYPGNSGAGEMDVRNTSPYDADLALQVTGLKSADNGCVRPESRVPGEDCDGDGGELDGWLTVTLTRDDALLWSGTLLELADGVSLGEPLAAGATSHLGVAVELPWEAGNDTMTDSVAFATRITGTSDAGESVVAGPEVHGSYGTTQQTGFFQSGPQVALPFVGGSVSLWMLVLDGLALAAGSLLVWRTRRAAPAPMLRPSRSAARRRRPRAGSAHRAW